MGLYTPIRLTFVRGFAALTKQKTSTQSVNSYKIAIDDIDDHLLMQLGISRNNIVEVSGSLLVQNVIPHDDKEFCDHNAITNACLVIIKNKHFDTKKYPDSPNGNYFFHNGEFVMLEEKCAYKFDPTQIHSIMNSSSILYVSIFYNGVDNFTKLQQVDAFRC